MMTRYYRQIIGANFIGRITVGGNTVGADNHPAYRALFHQVRARPFHHQCDGNIIFNQFPRCKTCSLHPRPGFVGKYLINSPRRVCRPNHT